MKQGLLIHNDGKSEGQSFRASVRNASDFNILDGYGSTKEEAISNLRKSVSTLIEQLNNAIDWASSTPVDCVNVPIGPTVFSDESWVCNECGNADLTSVVPEYDLEHFQCSACGANEFHLERQT